NGGATNGGDMSNGGDAGDDRLLPRCLSVLPLELNSDQGFPEGAPPLCELLPGGAGRMTFDLPACRDGSYAACDFAVGTNLNAFDADNDASGVLEIEFCVSSRISGQLNLWYGTFPTRKKI